MSFKPQTQNQVPQRPNPADIIKPWTPISHSAAFFHFSTNPPQKKKKTELALLSCGGPGTTGAALISARHRTTSAFPFRAEPSPSCLSPHRSGRNRKKKKKKKRGRKAKSAKEEEEPGRGEEETKARPIQLEFSCA